MFMLNNCNTCICQNCIHLQVDNKVNKKSTTWFLNFAFFILFGYLFQYIQLFKVGSYHLLVYTNVTNFSITNFIENICNYKRYRYNVVEIIVGITLS